MSSNHSEYEYKWDATDVSLAKLKKWANSRKPFRIEKAVAQPDVYYSHGRNIVRHRWIGTAGELTCKLRKSSTSIADRVEIDLRFHHTIQLADVSAFLAASGWKRTMTLFKNFVWVWWLKDHGTPITVAFYETEVLDEKTHKRIGTRRFLEVETEKNGPLSDLDARNLLETYRGILTKKFKLAEPLKESLYEIYSGKRYLMSTAPTSKTKKKSNGNRKIKNR